jgi:hypothetical protein
LKLTRLVVLCRLSSEDVQRLFNMALTKVLGKLKALSHEVRYKALPMSLMSSSLFEHDPALLPCARLPASGYYHGDSGWQAVFLHSCAGCFHFGLAGDGQCSQHHGPPS